MRTIIGWLAVSLLSCSAVSAREWTDVSGTFHIEAKLQGRVGKIIWLEKSNGDVARVRLEKLSQADRDFVTKELAADPLTPVPPTTSPRQLATANVPSTAKGIVKFATAASAQQAAAGNANETFATAASAQQAPAGSDADEKDERGWHWKFIYSACDVTGHLIIGRHPPAPSTVSYWRNGFHRLDGLHFEYFSPVFFHFRVIYPGSDYTHWAFGRESNSCGLYPVFAWHSSNNWHFKGWACRERVW
jgi:SLA1 homology domain 1, SHD1